MKLLFNLLRTTAEKNRIENLKSLRLFQWLTAHGLRKLDLLLHER